MTKDKVSKTNKQFNSDITYCTCYECPLECDRHPSHIPKDQKQASFADLYQICKPYINICVKEILK